jgi:phosphoribosyl-ATP pyrophosphohydrolase
MMSIQWLFEVIQSRRQNPSDKSYTSILFAEGLPKIAQKVGEEGTEVVVAALAQDDQRLIEEIADLTYHTLVLLAARGLTINDVLAELGRRHKIKDSEGK